ncbi:hypothetical protein AB0O14_19150 [Microbacterium foliorum]|uniref:hypothetical protein n=1 Tax=Rothia terrae TaxID=396015 RepID=UPI0034320D9E
MEYAQLDGQTDSITPSQYDRMLKDGIRNRQQDNRNIALRCGSCGAKAYLTTTNGTHSHPTFGAYHDPKDCPESSQAAHEIDGVVKRSIEGTRGETISIAPNQLDPLSPPVAPVHIREVAVASATTNLPQGKRTIRAAEPTTAKNRHLAPQTVLANLLIDNKRFAESMFTMPLFPKGEQDVVGEELIKEFSELDEKNIGQHRYVWGKIHNTHRITTDEGKTLFYLNGADQNNKSLESSILLGMKQNQQLMQHFLKTTQNSYCSNVWVIAYGQIKAKKGGGYLLAVYDNWKIHILTKQRTSRITPKSSRNAED